MPRTSKRLTELLQRGALTWCGVGGPPRWHRGAVFGLSGGRDRGAGRCWVTAMPVQASLRGGGETLDT